MKAWRRKRKIYWIHIKDILNISLVMIPRQNELNTDYYSRYIRWKEGNRSPQMQQPSQESEQEKAYDERRKTSKKKENIDEVLKSVKFLTTEMIQMKSQLSSLQLHKKKRRFRV
ncbi:hypothetical protein LXL04_036171 [Taraxacum kok-saghyz]